MKAFVTGGSGFIGRRLIDDLLAAGYEVTALVRTFDRARSLPPAVRTIAGDVNKPASLRLGLRGAEVVFHLAAWRNPGLRVKDPARLARTNVDGTRQVLELAGEAGVSRIVYTSALSLYGGGAGGRLLDETHAPRTLPADGEYERSKRHAHTEVVQPLQRQGLPIIIVCPSLVFGPGDKSPLQGLLRAYVRRRLPALIAAGAHNWAYVDDVAAGHRLAAERGRPGETYFLPGPALTFQQFFAAAERATGLPGPRLWLPAGLAGPISTALSGLNPGLAEALRSLDSAAGLASPAKAHAELGWTTSPLEDGLRATVAWLEAEAAAQRAEAEAIRAALEREREG